MKRKKILFLITKSNWGGAQRYVFDLATNLDPGTYDVAVALGGYGQLLDELKKKNIRTIPIGNLIRDISVLKEVSAIHELWNLIKSEKPDILHINSSKAGGLGAFVGRLLRVPQIIFTAHGWAFNEDRPWWQRLIIKKLHWITVLFSHVTIAVSETTEQQMDWPFVQKKMVVIHNGRTISNPYSREFARTFFAEYVPFLRDHVNDFWSATIGELHPIKQHDVTIRAIVDLVQEHKNIRHIIIGEGEERRRLESLIQELNLEHHVFLVGNIPEVSLYLKAFDTFVLASRSEALAYVIIEACIAGLPIIASNVGGIPEIITHEENGLLFPEGDMDMLARYYSELLHNEDRRVSLSRQALLRAQDFSFESMFEKTKTLYEQH